MQHEPVSLGHVSRDEVDPSFHQAGDEGHAAGQPVQLCNDQGGAVLSACGLRKGQLWPVAPPPAFHLREALDKLVVTIPQEVSNRPLLGLQAKAAAPLAFGGYPEVGDEAFRFHVLNVCKCWFRNITVLDPTD